MSEAKGTGKGILGRALVKAFGAHGLQLLQRSQLTGKFNAHHALMRLPFSDEAVRPDRVEDDNVLKGMITEDTIQIEAKGVDIMTMRNPMKVMLASNNQKIVQASEDERRYAVFEVSTTRRQQHAYFRRYKSARRRRTRCDDVRLAERALGEWHPRSGIPKTKALKAQQALSLGQKSNGYMATCFRAFSIARVATRATRSRVATSLHTRANCRRWRQRRPGPSYFPRRVGLRAQAVQRVILDFPPLPKCGPHGSKRNRSARRSQTRRPHGRQGGRRRRPERIRLIWTGADR